MEVKVFELEFAKSAQKFLEKIQKKDKDRIINKLILLAAGATNLDTKALVDSENLYRLRVGDYRIIYTQHFDILIIEVIKIDHRKDIYKK